MEEFKKMIFFALDSGKLLLESGAETYRVDNTIWHILNSRDIKCEAFVIPTGILLSATSKDNYIFSYFTRVYSISTDLRKITGVNELSRDFTSSDMTVEQAFARLEKIKNTKIYSPAARYVLGAAGASLTSMLLGGNTPTFILSFIATSATLIAIDYVKILLNSFVVNIAGGFVAAMTAFLLAMFSDFMGLPFLLKPDLAIAGALMVMVPGVAITNAVRDSITGDYVSGMTRTLDAIVTALSIALGVGLAIKILYMTVLS